MLVSYHFFRSPCVKIVGNQRRSLQQDFRTLRKAFTTSTTWKPTEWLGGKSNGVWRTSKAKVYPEKLCKVLALSHDKHAVQLQCEGTEDIPDHLSPVIKALTAIHDPYDETATGTTMQYDSHKLPSVQ